MIGRIALGGGIAAATAAGVGWAIARRLTAPVGPRKFDLPVRGVEHDEDGIYNLWFDHGGWAQLSAEVVDRGPTRVARRIKGTAPDFSLKVDECASWSGIYYATPADAGLHARDISITTPAGPCPAWRIDGDPSM